METLLHLHSHQLCVHVWNKQDKLSIRARFDRPKAFRLPSPHPKQRKGEEEIDAEDSDGRLSSRMHKPEKLPLVLQELGTGLHKRLSRQFTSLEDGGDGVPQGKSPSRKGKPAVPALQEDDEKAEGKRGGVKGGVRGGGSKGPTGVDPLFLSDPGKRPFSGGAVSSVPQEDLAQSAFTALKGES